MSTLVTGTNRAVGTRRWVVDPSRSTVEFRVKHVWGLRTVICHFTRFEHARHQRVGAMAAPWQWYDLWSTDEERWARRGDTG